MTVDRAWLQGRLDTLAEQHDVPGASLALLHDGETITAATGVLNRGTGVEATTDSLFQIGSITKTMTATVVMRLVDEGRLDLDRPVVEVLPEFKVADPEVTASVTLRHLLTHTSGIEGDVFDEVGRGDDCLERYTALCAKLDQLHPLGATMSYCNSGFSVAGRVIEVVTGKVWDAAMRDLLFEPLGMKHSFTLPEDVLRFRAALGHVGPGWEPAPRWDMPRSLGPAGTVCATAEDLITFAKLHLAGGLAADGTRVLSAESVQAMQTPQVALPDRWSLADHWGIGWLLPTWEGQRVYGHDGATIGQAACLRVLPDQDSAVVLLTNGGRMMDLWHALANEIATATGGPHEPDLPKPPAEPVQHDLADWYGTYDSYSMSMEIASGDDGEPTVRLSLKQEFHKKNLNDATPAQPLIPVDPSQGLYLAKSRPDLPDLPFVLFSLDDGTRYLHFGGRAIRKSG